MTYTPPKKRHWQKFNFAEWRNDDKLRNCSRGARSLWLDMCGLIYEANDGGKLILDGKNPDHMALAKYFKDNGTAVKTWLDELERKGVFDRTDDGYIVSRRISRELLKAENDARNGKKGGNPDLISKAKGEEGVNAKSQSQNQIDSKLAARGVILSVTGPGMADPDSTRVTKSLDRMLDAWLGLYDLELDIVPVIRARTGKIPKTGKIQSFDYLDKAMAEHHAGRISGLFAMQNPPPVGQQSPSAPPKPSKSEPITLPKGKARVAAHAILEECGPDHYRAKFATAEWNGTTVALDQWNINGVKPEARQILAEEGWEIVAKG